MVNRTMQAKALKLRRQKRAWARPLSVKSGIRPNTEVIKAYKESARGLALSDQELDQLIYMIWGRKPFIGVSEPRKAVLDVLTRMREDVPEFLYRTILQNNYQRVRAYQNSLGDLWVITHEDFRKNFIRRSIEYASLEVAKYRWTQQRVCWVFQRTLPVPELPPLYPG